MLYYPPPKPYFVFIKRKNNIQWDCVSISVYMNIGTHHILRFSSLDASSVKSNIWPCDHFTSSQNPLVTCTDPNKALALNKYVLLIYSRTTDSTVSCAMFVNAHKDMIIRNQAFAPCRVICVNDICKLCLLLSWSVSILILHRSVLSLRQTQWRVAQNQMGCKLWAACQVMTKLCRAFDIITVDIGKWRASLAHC